MKPSEDSTPSPCVLETPAPSRSYLRSEALYSSLTSSRWSSLQVYVRAFYAPLFRWSHDRATHKHAGAGTWGLGRHAGVIRVGEGCGYPWQVLHTRVLPAVPVDSAPIKWFLSLPTCPSGAPGTALNHLVKKQHVKRILKHEWEFVQRGEKQRKL